MRRAVSRPRRQEQGAVAVEFALVLPLLLMLVFGMIDFGRILNAQISLTHAAREGVRASVSGVTDVESVVRRSATAAVTVDSVQVTRCPTTGGGNTTVTASSTMTYITPIAAFVPGLGTSMRLNGQGVARCVS